MANLNFNRVMVCGRLTADPELKTITSGVSVTKFSVAVNKPGKQNQADFFNVTAWRSTAEVVTQYFHKGSSIFIEGTLTQRMREDGNGKKHSAVEIIADKVYFVDSISESRTEAPRIPANTADRARKDAEFVAAQNTFVEINDDDLPF